MMTDYISNVLVVDDKVDIIEIIKSALEDQPVKVYAANNGQEALQLLQQFPFDIMLLDVKMPDISGFEICQIVKNSEQWRNIKVIIVSASNLSTDKLRGFDVGADDYISKPFRVKELQARIRVMLNLRTAERDLTERNNQLLELLRVSEVLNSRAGQPQTLFEEVVKSALRLAKADCATLLLWDEDSKQHTVVATAPTSTTVVVTKPITLREGEGLAGQIQRSGQPIFIENYSDWEFHYNFSDLPVYNTGGLPIRLGPRHLGVILVAMSSPQQHFAQRDLEIMGTLANQTAIALDNARLYGDLSESEGRYRLLAENASDLIITLDRQHLVTYVNERVRTLLGFKPDEVIGQNFGQLLSQEGQLTLKRISETLMAGGATALPTPPPTEFEAYNKEGEPINLEFNWGLLLEQNEIIGLQAIGRDVTMRKRETEQERMRALGQMASGVAHDFNNVLANVLGHAQLLETETQNPEMLHTLRIIEQSALDGAETVRRIQEFTGQHLKQKLDLIDLNAIVQSTLELSRPRWRDDAQAKGLKIEIERDLAVLPLIRGKAAELREVLINLINNALDAMPEEGGKIGFHSFTEKEMVCLDVWDSGRGMSPEVRRHIFEPFYTTKGVLGTGLGLSIAYGIISRYGGSITCESSAGLGTVFHIHLPVAQTEANPEEVPGRLVGWSGKLKKYQGRILVIDDETNIRMILNRTLSMSGFTVDVAASGREALRLLESAAAKWKPPYDLVFSDLGMPEMSGWEVARLLHQHWPEIPLVLITGWGEQLDPIRIAERHVSRTIAKPFNISEVVAVAAQLVPQPEMGPSN